MTKLDIETEKRERIERKQQAFHRLTNQGPETSVMMGDVTCCLNEGRGCARSPAASARAEEREAEKAIQKNTISAPE